MPDPLSRRSFVQAAATAMAPAVVSSLGASKKVPVGVIGTGSRGNYLIQRLHAGNKAAVEILGVCDTYAGHLARAKDGVATMWGNTPKTFKNYRDLLADPSIDTVIIATPEHLHYEMTLAAIKAGKNIYIEKPLAHTIEEGEEILKVAKASGKTIQVGTQNRSNSLYGMARQMIAQGLVGEIHYVRAFWYRNSQPNDPAWRYVIPKDASPENSDWDLFLGTAPKRPFDKRRYYQWRLYWDYSGGISTDLLVHQTDITNFVCGKAVPTSCVASGGVYRWTDPDDDRDVPDTLSAIYEYPDKFHINYSCYFGNDHFGYGEQFCGNEGTIEVVNRSQLSFWPESFRGRPPAHVAARKALTVELPGNDNLAVEAHLRNLLEAVQGKAQLIAPVEVGQQAAISGHLATLAYRNRKMAIWDEKTRKVRYA